MSKSTSLPLDIRRLNAGFQTQLVNTLGKNLVGAYLFGSIAFPGFEPRSGDIDFYVLIRRPLTQAQIRDLNTMHRILSAKFRFGNRLDGFYITLAKARKRATPTRLRFAADGRLRMGGRDDAWALHREHLRQGVCIVLHGPKPVSILQPASWNEIEKALNAEVSFAKSLVHRYSFWTVLSLCRVICTLKNRDVVISKIQAARWALRTLPNRWKPLIRSALRVYLKKQKQGDQRMLKCNADEFLNFALTAWQIRNPLQSEGGV